HRRSRPHPLASRHQHPRHEPVPAARLPQRRGRPVGRRRPRRPRACPGRGGARAVTSTVRWAPARKLRGTVRPPADKSISHRAAIFGAMAAEPVRVHNYLHAEDTTSTLNAMRSLGALVTVDGDVVTIRGTGLRDAGETDGPIDVGNAGTLM